MEIAYLHLVTNHLPIIGVPFGLAVLLLGIWRKSSDLKAAGFLIFIFLGFATIGVYLLGQGGEDFIEELPGVSHDAIEDHESVATFALISVTVLALASLYAFIRYKGYSLLLRRKETPANESSVEARPGFPAWISFAVVLLGLVSSGILGYTGRLGGKIRHPEFHEGTQTIERDGEDGERGRGRRGRRSSKRGPPGHFRPFLSPPAR